ncbi:hypothetical protein HMPREF1212_04706 [Parabacteroides sp. HGS0025]|uniref:dynamin family protein n=1 Tax=Parabacteroides sp. HGS0025 TaxID=1078087 RepID=UPI00061749B8|nr:dynamin family protein [Parabacteroides sp. HGS0025]KKB45512.1 hypothetical protein HMPREF1212_05185 [Parabacteroides sp. HGS0025]KKB46086.1 hypothetical protein HMPREF1212_04706 [Parabacteroides sp. HGS0025]
MKQIKIKYNPYLLSTEILIDGKKPKANSKLNFGKLRIQEWSSRLPEILIEECSDRNYEIEFIGTETDYNDLKCSIESFGQISCNLLPKFQQSVSDVEIEVDKLFDEIKKGPVEQLRDKSILNAFEKAKNQEFEINVVATMSSGKSTLINALLDKKLMPVANMATTATIVRIIDTDQDNFAAIAYDSKGNKLKEDPNIVYRTMREWNTDTSISAIDIYGRIPCVDSVGMRLVLVDTPGPNNSQDANHRHMTYKMLEDSDKSLVLFVMNGRQLNVDDQKNFMDYVCECMDKGGKQSRERYIFAINQMDSFNPEDENPEDALKSAREVLEDYHILSPNLFPVSALAALECRNKPAIPKVLPVFGPLVQEYPEMRFDTYYSYNNLPVSAKHDIDSMLEKLSPEEAVEIHSGIVSIEAAIGLYIDKYARALKVKDLVDSFNNRLNELRTVASLQENIRKNKELKVKLDQKIADIQNRIESGKSAQTLSRLIDKEDLSSNVKDDIDDYVDVTKTKIEKIIFRFNNSDKVKKTEALYKIKDVEKESLEILNQLDSRISTILECGFKTLYKTILDEYKGHLTDLGITASNQELFLHPLDFVAEELDDLNRLMDQNSTTVDEGHNEERTRTVRGKRKTNWLFAPWTWGSERYETREESYTVHIPNNIEYVNMSKVIADYLEPLQEQLRDAKSAAYSHAQSESNRIKKHLKDYLIEIDNVLCKKLEELKLSTESSNRTQAEINRQVSNLKWMEEIIERVNKLIYF